MLRRLATAAVLIALLLSALVPSSLARGTPGVVSPAAGDIADVPPALAQAGIAPSAWGRMVDQIHAQQALNGCPACPGGATPFSEQATLAASDGAAGDQFGFAVDIWGDTVVVGAFTDDIDSITDQGSAYVFVRNQGGTDNWGEVKKLTASDGAAGDLFGTSVDIWGDTVVVGSVYDDTSPMTDHGSAYVFMRNQGGADNWGQVTKLTASDGAAGDWFGYSVAVWGDTVVVGSRFDDVTYSDQGSAYVFMRNQGGADNWGQVIKLTASDAAAHDEFGGCVAVWGDTVVVGSRFDDVTYSDQGSAYVFMRNQGGADNWGQTDKLFASDGAANDYFGGCVAIWGDTVVVGAMYGDGTVADVGSAYVFMRNQGGADNWGQVIKLTASDGAASDSFGFAASIWGDTVVVGAYRADVAGSGDQGAAYVFRRNEGGADNWGQTDKLFAADGTANDYFGWYVDIWGDTVVAGAYGADVGDNGDQGAAYVFTAPCTPDSELKKETAADGAADDQFGRSVAIWGDTVVVGSRFDEVDGNPSQGLAYVFQRNHGGADNWGEVKKLAASDGTEGDYFGYSVAIWGDTIVVGAQWADIDDTVDQGSAYVYRRDYDPDNPANPLADNWGEVIKLTASDGAEGDQFGNSVAIWGPAIVVGSVFGDGDAADQGAAYIFERNQGGPENWGETAKLTASDGAGADSFGWSVAIWGPSAVVVGSLYSDSDGEDDQGSAYVFQRNYDPDNPTTPLADNWGEVIKLTALDGVGYDEFGNSVAIWGDTVVVGAQGDDTYQGSAYIFVRNQGGADTWGQLIKLTAADGAADDYFGYSVAIWGDTVIVGSLLGGTSGNPYQGAAYVFERNHSTADNWGEVKKLVASDGAAEDYFGYSVGIWGDTLVVGSPYDDTDTFDDQGSTYILVCGGTGAGDVSISKAGEPGLVRRGETLTYTLSYTSTSCPSTGVWVTDTLPAGVVYDKLVSAADGWTGPSISGQVVSWYTPTLANCATGSFVFTGIASLLEPISADWVLANEVAITATADLTPTNNLSQAMSVFQGLEIRKSHFPATVTAAWDFWYYIDVTNTATSPATNLVVTDTLPVGVAAYSVQPDPGGVFDGVNTVVWTIPSLGPNATMRLTIKARTYSTQAGNCLTNNAVADSEQAAPPVSASDTICVVKGELTRPTPTPTPAATPVPPGTTVVIKRGGPGTSLDTYIYRNQPYSNYWLEPLLKVGYKQTNATLIQFDLSPIPAGAKVDEAWLEVWAAGWSGPFSDMTIGAYAISETVQISQTTWVSPELGMTWGLAGANDVVLDRRAVPESTVTTSGPLLWYRFDVARLVQEWLDGGTANNGAMLRCESCVGRRIGVLVSPPEGGELPPPTDGIFPVPIGLPGNLCPYTHFFASSEYSNPAVWPRLVVRYE